MKKYELVAKQIEDKIESGVYVEKLPPLRALASSYHVSINTIRSALELLTSQNIIYIKHGSGHYIKHTHTYNLLNFKASKIDDLDNSTRLEQTLLRFDIVRSDNLMAELLEITEGQLIYKIKRLRTFKTRPQYIEHIIISYDLLPKLNQETLNDSLLLYAQEELHSEIDFSANTVEAITLDEDMADLLNEQIGCPALLIKTHYFLKSGVKFAYYTTIHVNSSFDFIARP